ncbi:MAG: C40 family peptidase [Clostridia bacterium]|nr:C40 family peptidase [Clostridia bacterium]MBR3955856.1 C40 family peptidase [Clostridia bacterium]
MKITKKIISACLCLFLLASFVLPVFANKAHYDAPLRVPPLSGNLRADLYKVAKSQLGYQEDVFGGTYFGEWWTEVVSGKEFDDPWEGYIDIDCTDADWCAIFLCWVMEKAGCAYGYTYNVLSGTVGYMFELLKAGEAEIYTYSDDMEYEPKLGDLAFYTYDNGKTLSHVAITDGNNHYIHANYANSVVELEGNIVYKIAADDYFKPAYIVSPNYNLSEESGNSELRAAVLGFEAGIIYLPYRLKLELENLFNTDDEGTAIPPAPPIVEEIIPGDADRDGILSAGDARLILRASVELETLSEEQMKRADLNGDGKCTADEARTVLRLSVGLTVD